MYTKYFMNLFGLNLSNENQDIIFSLFFPCKLRNGQINLSSSDIKKYYTFDIICYAEA